MDSMKQTVPTVNRRVLHIPLKAEWPRKPTDSTQCIGVPLFDSDNNLVVVVRPCEEPEPLASYLRRLAAALALARSIRNSHNKSLTKRPKRNAVHPAH